MKHLVGLMEKKYGALGLLQLLLAHSGGASAYAFRRSEQGGWGAFSTRAQLQSRLWMISAGPKLGGLSSAGRLS